MVFQILGVVQNSYCYHKFRLPFLACPYTLHVTQPNQEVRFGSQAKLAMHNTTTIWKRGDICELDDINAATMPSMSRSNSFVDVDFTLRRVFKKTSFRYDQ
jgi:hypothetical protein